MESSEPTDLKLVNGTISIENGEFIIVDASEGGKQPVLYPHPDLRIEIDGKAIQSPTAVSSNLSISWMLNPPSYSIELSSDQTQVFLQIQKSAFQQYRLRDIPPCFQARVELESSPYPIEALEEDILRDLESLGIKVPILQKAIRNELRNPTYEPCIVAEGKPAVPSQDGYLENVVSTQVEEILEEVNGQVDFRNRYRIPLVNKGDVIAVLHPPVEGKEGLDVFGKEMVPQQPKELLVRLGRDVQMGAEGQIIALQEGRPSIKGQDIKTVEVTRVYQIDENIDILTGNVFFLGDVQVNGDICEHMTVEAAGNIYVSGNVYSAQAVSTQDIYIRGNTFNSEILSGQLGSSLSQLHHLLKELTTHFVDLSQAAKQTLEALGKKGGQVPLGRLLQMLLDSKFKMIGQLVQELNQRIEEMGKRGVRRNDYALLQRSLQQFTQADILLSLRSLHPLQGVVQMLKKELMKLEESTWDESEVLLGSSTNCTIKANGNVIFTGKGMVNSQINAGKDCIFNHPQSVIKGGEIIANENIMAQEVGSETGAIPHLQAGKSIKAKRIYNGRIKIKDAIYNIEQPHQMVKFVFDKEKYEVSVSPY